MDKTKQSPVKPKQAPQALKQKTPRPASSTKERPPRWMTGTATPEKTS
jgi:hypothetical protein